MKLVADTNIFLAVVLNGLEKQRIIELTLGSEIIAPEILPYEIGNALSAMLKRRQLSAEESLLALEKTQQIPVELLKTNIKNALEIAITHNIYAYDAYFLQTVLAHHCPLLTLDKKMKDVANALSITVLE
jgi:predicted nucleic acid-binding protein